MGAQLTTVESIEPDGDRWIATTADGFHDHVDQDGVGSELVPLDEQWARDFATKGPEFIVVREDRIIIERPPPPPRELYSPEPEIGGRDGIS